MFTLKEKSRKTEERGEKEGKEEREAARNKEETKGRIK